MSNCCNAKVIDPSGEGIEGICADCGEHCEVVSDSQFDEKLDEILEGMYHAAHADGLDFLFRLKPKVERYKKSITFLIASHLGAIIDANTDENGTDSDRVYEVLMEWMGELQGGGDE